MGAASIYTQLQKLSNEATKKTLDYNAKEANTARTWQERMSNTSHQREVADLLAAGLNPVLSSNQGAQSYTTSAASGQAENAANAVANAYSADQSAAATRAAAASSAAATRYAADQNLKAAQAAAYANMYSADKHYEGTRYSTDHSKSGSPFGILDNLYKRLVKGSDEKKFINSSIKEVKGFFGKTDHKRISGLGYSWLNLDKAGRNFVDNQLRKSGLTVNQNMRNLYIKANLQQKESSARLWLNTVRLAKERRVYHSGRAWSAGSGVW